MDWRSALIREVEAHPEDPGGWAALADYLEEKDQPQPAELVRLSLALRRAVGEPGRAHWEGRLRQLVSQGVSLPLPRRVLKIGKSVEMSFVQIPPGSFLMGSPSTEFRRDEDEGPLHQVTLSRAFWMSVSPATQEQWQEVMGTAPPGQFRGALLPVEGVSWMDCQEFLTALGERLSLRFRLPSEAEWEYACRGLTSSPFWFGDQATTREANFDGNYPYGGSARSEWRQRTSPVGTYPPNLWGLHDTHGNVWEWCQDWYEEGYYQHAPSVDPTGPDEGELRVLRGGSWYSYSWSCRSAGRERFDPRSGNGNHGFRVVADLLPND